MQYHLPVLQNSEPLNHICPYSTSSSFITVLTFNNSPQLTAGWLYCISPVFSFFKKKKNQSSACRVDVNEGRCFAFLSLYWQWEACVPAEGPGQRPERAAGGSWQQSRSWWGAPALGSSLEAAGPGGPSHCPTAAEHGRACSGNAHTHIHTQV